MARSLFVGVDVVGSLFLRDVCLYHTRTQPLVTLYVQPFVIVYCESIRYFSLRTETEFVLRVLRGTLLLSNFFLFSFLFYANCVAYYSNLKLSNPASECVRTKAISHLKFLLYLFDTHFCCSARFLHTFLLLLEISYASRLNSSNLAL